jgi:hypothetical protein
MRATLSAPIARGEAATSPATVLVLGVTATVAVSVALGSLGQPVVALSVGVAVGATIVLVRSSPVAYLGITLWAWMLCPFLRRVVDAQSSFQENSLFILAPFLLSGMSVLTVLRKPQMLAHPAFRPMVYLAAAIAIATPVSLIKLGPQPAMLGALDWLTPLLLGVYVAANYRIFPAMVRFTHITAMVGIAVISIYGIVQFFSPPRWDRFWMLNVPQLNTIGKPEPFEIRVFSTMNAPVPFAVVLVILCMLLALRPSPLKIVLYPLAALSLAVSLVRSAWLGLVAGLLAMLLIGGSRSKGRSVLMVVVVLPTCFLLLQSGPVGKVFSQRASSVGSGSDDGSANDRLNSAGRIIPVALSNPIGHGVGSTGTGARAGDAQGADVIQAIDNGLLDIFYSLGVVGGTVFFVGLVGAIRFAFTKGGDPIVRRACMAAVITSLANLLFLNSLVGAAGAFTFLALGLAIANRLYTAQQEQFRHSVGRVGTAR